MNYCSPQQYGMVDDFRKTTDVEVPKRAQYLRVIVMELARITDTSYL
jgi:NADH-quinone oxidoreductase subunit D